MQRLGTPDDVAQGALFLAADTASWISGIVRDVAGGAVLFSAAGRLARHSRHNLIHLAEHGRWNRR